VSAVSVVCGRVNEMGGSVDVERTPFARLRL
jgi:hypothetical protein